MTRRSSVTSHVIGGSLKGFFNRKTELTKAFLIVEVKPACRALGNGFQ